MNAKQESQIADLKTSLAISEKMNEVLKKEVEMTNKNFEQMKEVADRAIKLAETKKTSVWETWGPLGIIAIIVVTIAATI